MYCIAPYRYKEGGCETKDFIPISLLHKEFGNFLKLYTSQDPSNIDIKDMEFLQGFIISMAMIYPSEEERNAVVLNKLGEYINQSIVADNATSADGMMSINRHVKLI